MEASLFILHTLCCQFNCLANLRLEKGQPPCRYTTRTALQSHTDPGEPRRGMNDLDNATGLPATQRQFLVTTERRGDEKISGRLIENTPPSKSQRSD